MKTTADQILGKRFEFVGGTSPDVTVVAIDAAKNKIRVHVLGGDRQWIALDVFEQAREAGALLEALAAPFVHERVSKFAARHAALRMYVAGPNKQPMRGFAVIAGGKHD